MKFIYLLLFLLIENLIYSETNFVTNIEQYKIDESLKGTKEVEKYLKEREEKIREDILKREKESPLRRFEVIFFSSGAMVYITTLFMLKIYQEFTTGESSNLPDVQWYYIGLNSIGLATYISIKDYYENKNKFIEECNYRNLKFSLLNIKF